MIYLNNAYFRQTKIVGSRMTNPIRIRSTVYAKDIKTVLLRGTFISLVGVFLICYSGTWLPAVQLNIWGSVIFLTGLGLITWGMIPYRKLTQLQIHAHELIVTPDFFSYAPKGKMTLTIPFSALQKSEFLQVQSIYGIALHLKKNPKEKIQIHDHYFNVSSFRRKSQKQFGCDLFLPYFTEKSWRRLTMDRPAKVN